MEPALRRLSPVLVTALLAACGGPAPSTVAGTAPMAAATPPGAAALQAGPPTLLGIGTGQGPGRGLGGPLTPTREQLQAIYQEIVDLATKLIAVKASLSTLKADVAGTKAAVTGVKSEVSGLTTEVTDLKSDVTGLKTDVSGLDATVSGLTLDVASLSAGLATLGVELAGLRGEVATLRTGLADAQASADAAGAAAAAAQADATAAQAAAAAASAAAAAARAEAAASRSDAALARSAAATAQSDAAAARAEAAIAMADAAAARAEAEAQRADSLAGLAAHDDVLAAMADRITALEQAQPTPAPTPGAVRLTTLAGGARGFADGDGATARFAAPRDLAADAQGNVYVADFENHRVRRVAPDGTTTTVAGAGVPGFADGAGASARFDRPADVAVDAAGDVWVADFGNNRVRRIAGAGGPSPVVTTVAGGVSGFADGPGATARFRGPCGLAFGPLGELYVADYDNHRVRRLAPDGSVVSWAGSALGQLGFVDGPQGTNMLYYPTDVAAGADGTVYVADGGNHAIRRIAPDRVMTTWAGRGPGSPGATDGPASQARFNRPSGLALDGTGGLYVADRYNHLIRYVAADGLVSTVAGSGVPGFRDDAARLAELNTPTGVTIDAAGRLVVADNLNHRIRGLE